MQSRIQIVYHITCLNNWRDVVHEQLTRIIFSGLYDLIESVHCFVVSLETEQYTDIITFLASFGSKIILQKIVSSGNESVALNFIRTIVEPDDKVLYLHTKGVTRYKQTNISLHHDQITVEVPNLDENVQSWRDMMEFFLIKEFKRCLSLLDSVDVVGSNLCNNPNHFAGNFWWARGKHLLSLPPCDHDSMEEWVMSIDTVNFATLYQSNVRGYGLYLDRVPLKMYVDVDNQSGMIPSRVTFR